MPLNAVKFFLESKKNTSCVVWLIHIMLRVFDTTLTPQAMKAEQKQGEYRQRSTILIAFKTAFDILPAAFSGMEKTRSAYQGFTEQFHYISRNTSLPHLQKLTMRRLEKYW